MRMKSSNEFTPKEMKKLLERMIRIKDILTSNGYYVPETGNMKCPFHINEHTPAAKYYPDSNCIYCFTEHKIYRPSDALELVGIDYKQTFKEIWDTLNAKDKDNLIQTLDQVYETKILFKEPLKKFKTGVITYQELCEEITPKLTSHLPMLQFLYNISRDITEATINADDYTYLACIANLNNIKQLTSGEIIKYQDQFKYYRYIFNFIRDNEDVVLIFNMNGTTPIGCTLRSKKSHNFIDVGNTGGLFYGLCSLSKNFQYGDPIVIVEGPKDCETYRKVFNNKNCLALMTSNFSSAQLEVLKYLTNKIILANDNDSAGIKAQKEFIKWNKKSFNINVIHHPDNLKDFGDIIPLIRYDKNQLKVVVAQYKIQIENAL